MNISETARAEIKKAAKQGYIVTDTAHGVTTMVRDDRKGGSITFVNIDQDTGKRL